MSAKKLLDRLRVVGDPLHEGALVAGFIVTAVIVLWIVMWLWNRGEPDPALGKATVAVVAAKGAATQATVDKAIPEMRERIQAPIRKHTEKARHYAAKIEAAPTPAGAVAVPDDDAYRGLCQPGGVYKGDPERGRECRKLKG